MTGALITLKIDQAVSGLVRGDSNNTSLFSLTYGGKNPRPYSPEPALMTFSTLFMEFLF